MIVAIESSSTDISLAVGASGGELRGHDWWVSDRRQGHELLPRLLALLAREGVAARDIGAVAIGVGPGSFTGLRVGMSVAKGFALGVGCPVVGVPSLGAWLASVPEARAAIGRAGAREVYLQRREGAAVEIVDVAALHDGLLAATVIAPTELAAAVGLRGARPPSMAAAALLRMGAERLAREEAGDDVVHLEPAYLRAPRGIGQLDATGSS